MNNEDTEKRPPIAEKVKFWLEQDRINKELIPRVIKVHETVTKHIEGHEEASAAIVSMEARFVEQIKEAEARVTQETEARFNLKINRVRMQAMVVSVVSLVVAIVSIVLSVVMSL